MGRDGAQDGPTPRRKRQPIVSRSFVGLVGSVCRLGGDHRVTADEFKAWFNIWQRNLVLWEFVPDD